MVEQAMSVEERNDLAELKEKEKNGTITAAEQIELDNLRDTYQCE
jgi:uncharacterized protein YnzC (UPF0291/DUF896 family)